MHQATAYLAALATRQLASALQFRLQDEVRPCPESCQPTISGILEDGESVSSPAPACCLSDSSCPPTQPPSSLQPCAFTFGSWRSYDQSLRSLGVMVERPPASWRVETHCSSFHPPAAVPRQTPAFAGRSVRSALQNRPRVRTTSIRWGREITLWLPLGRHGRPTHRRQPRLSAAAFDRGGASAAAGWEAWGGPRALGERLCLPVAAARGHC